MFSRAPSVWDESESQTDGVALHDLHEIA